MLQNLVSVVFVVVDVTAVNIYQLYSDGLWADPPARYSSGPVGEMETTQYGRGRQPSRGGGDNTVGEGETTQ